VIDRLAAYGADVASKSYVAYSSVPEYVRYRPAQPPPYDGRPYIFYLSGVLWYKNHLNLIEGYRRAVAGGADLPDLLFAGRSEEPVYVSRINAAIEQGHLTGRVRYLGFIPRESIPGYLHHATINAFASTCETNSFAETEILGAHGVLACSNCPPMPEIAAGAAELFDPFDPDSIAATLVKLYRDRELREQLRERAARRAGELTPERQGEVVWAAIHHARQAFRTNGARRTGVT
jgi:glycosyltransferase involved in cell wall biosynthesis